MAKRKKREFRPDPSGTSLWSRLILTRKQQLSLLRWSLFALTLLVLSLVQDTILCRLWVFGATTDLVPCAIFLICMFLGTESCCAFALVSSLLFQFSGSGPGNYAIVAICFLALGANIFRQSFLRKGVSASVLCSAAALLVYEVLVFLVSLAMGLTFWARILIPFLTWGLSLVAVPALYPIVSAIDRIGGETWKE